MLNPLLGLLALEFGLAIASDLLGRLHPADGTCGDIGPGGLRGPGPAGQTGPRAAPDHGPDEPDEPAVRPGAGCDPRGQPGHRPAGLRAVADPAARAGTA
ncbi:hypothetical protein G6F24_017551 [Rhizopus arrhizus]|nr:hypothetical protein G6F24_017551 [Rhizopus arrhizus]